MKDHDHETGPSGHSHSHAVGPDANRRWLVAALATALVGVAVRRLDADPQALSYSAVRPGIGRRRGWSIGISSRIRFDQVTAER